MTEWESVLKTNYEQLMGYLIAYVPQVIGAMLLLFIGWVIAWIFSRLVLSLVSFMANLFNKATQALSLDRRINIKPQHSKIVSRITFWIIIAFFLAASLSSLGIDFIASWLRELLGYLPNILAGIIIVVGGFFIGNVANTMTQAAGHSTGLKYSERIGLLVKYVIVSIAIVIGIEQLGINIQFVTTLVIVELAVLSFGIALAYGLGSNELIKNLVGSRQAIKHLNVGEYIQLGGFEGKILALSQTSLELETETGKVFIPAKYYTETPCVVISENNGKNEIR